jgi:phage antirepressor YoqD-like protein
MDSGLLTGIRETAKLFGIKQNQLVQFLLSTKYAYRNGKGVLLPYENKNRGYFTVKEVRNQQTGWFIVMFMFTPKGRAYFHRILFKYNSDQFLLQSPV